jgi:Anti-sigma-K factor rskA, C-terminal/Putative zinc-finger
MNEHAEMRNLLGPYVMDALQPYEERGVEDHLRDCAGCREEAQELRIAHERLLDLAYAIEAPPQDLEVAANIPRPRDRRRLPAWLAAVAAVFCVLGVLGTIFLPGLFGGRALASATLTPTDLAPEAGGEVNIEDANGNMEVRLEAWGLPPCEDDRYYELWLVEGEERVSAGSFTVGPSGKVDVNMTAPAFASSYPAVGITYEHDKDPRASDAKMLSGELHEL